MTQQFHFGAFIRRKRKHQFEKITHTTMFIAALFTVAKIWKNLGVHQYMDKKDVHAYNGILLGCKKENEILSFSITWTSRYCAK